MASHYQQGTKWQSGLDAAKPTSSQIGDVYFATDTLLTYVCYAANTWKVINKVQLGYFQRDTAVASGFQAITGIGFKPKVITINASVVNTLKMSIGEDDKTTNIHCQARDPTNGWGAVIGFSIWLQDTSIINYYGRVSSFDADGFTIQWIRVGAPSGLATITFTAYP